MKRLCFVLALALVATVAGAGQFVIPRPELPEHQLIPGQYLVQFTPGAAGGHPHSLAQQLARGHNARILFVYEALGGAAFAMNENQARAMARNPNVAVVEQDMTSHVTGDQASPHWGLDRVDQRDLPLDANYHWDYDGTGVEAYIVDGGIRTTHVDFGGRATWGIDCTGKGLNDGNGHGTHVAGTVGGATWGVAKNVNLIAVRVCNNNGSCQNSWISCGFDYVAAQKIANPGQPMVANYSIGGSFSQTINDWVAAVADAGVFIAVAAVNGNGADACNYSPASEPKAFTVGSTTSSDARSSFSNRGPCLDIFAPGSSIKSAYHTSDTATKTLSGTSMASPHAAGAGALVLQQYPLLTPAQVSDELKARGTPDVISNPGTGSPNLLLYTLPGTPPPPDCSVDADCDDGLFCTGTEICNGGFCQAGGSPCLPGEICNETADTCDPECVVDADCDDGLFCNGAETCNAGSCQAGGDPCQAGELCDEGADLCQPGCSTDADCDDGLFCNGAETCNAGTCEAGNNPCNQGNGCNESTDQCNGNQQ